MFKHAMSAAIIFSVAASADAATVTLKAYKEPRNEQFRTLNRASACNTAAGDKPGAQGQSDVPSSSQKVASNDSAPAQFSAA